MEIYANLHTHSTHSDGKLTPFELVKTAEEEGYKAIAVTDHDTATAYGELKNACRELDMECIFGVEFSTFDEMGQGFHLVGFNFDPSYQPMAKYLRDLSIREAGATKEVFNRRTAEGKIKGIEWSEVLDYNKGITWLCNEHVFRAMKHKGLVTDSDYPKFFDENFRGYWDWVNDEIPLKGIREITDLIHKSGGIAIIAHPAGVTADKLKQLMDLGVDGFEVWHPDLNGEERKVVYDFCIKNKLYISGGSDHSGLCGGLYASFEDPTVCDWYIEPLSAGTTKEFYEEIRHMKKNRG